MSSQAFFLRFQNRRRNLGRDGTLDHSFDGFRLQSRGDDDDGERPAQAGRDGHGIGMAGDLVDFLETAIVDHLHPALLVKIGKLEGSGSLKSQ